MTRSENDSSLGDPFAAGLDALDAEHGPARPLSTHEASAMAERVLQRHAATSRRGGAHGPFVRRGRRRWSRWLLAAGGVTLATAAAAVYGTSGFKPNRAASGTDRPEASAPREAAPERASAPGANERAELAPSPTPPDASPGSSGRPTDERLHRSEGAGGGTARTVAHESRRAADHLARANALRGRHQYREALALYLYVVSEYPGSMQSRAAQLAAAAIRLEQLTDIDGAEELYRAVRNSSDGELAAQAAFGLAEVARARADRGAEVRALREFLGRHGAHPLAAAARRRLNALESP